MVKRQVIRDLTDASYCTMTPCASSTKRWALCAAELKRVAGADFIQSIQNMKAFELVQEQGGESGESDCDGDLSL